MLFLPYPIGNWNKLWKAEYCSNTSYLTLLGIETGQSIHNIQHQNLTLPYWELKLVIMSTSTRWNRLTLPYWELKRINCQAIKSNAILTLPYWELKQQSHLCFGIKKIPLPYPIGDFITQKSSFSVGLKLLFSYEQGCIVHEWRPYRFWRGETIRPYV